MESFLLSAWDDRRQHGSSTLFPSEAFCSSSDTVRSYRHTHWDQFSLEGQGAKILTIRHDSIEELSCPEGMLLQLTLIECQILTWTALVITLKKLTVMSNDEQSTIRSVTPY